MKAPVGAAYEVDSGHRDVNAARRLDTGRGVPELRRTDYQVTRNRSVLDDLAFAIDVGDESVERSSALDQAGFESGPDPGRDDPGNRVEGEYSLPSFMVAVDVEGHAHRLEHPMRALSEFG